MPPVKYPIEAPGRLVKEPVYQQLARLLRELAVSGELPPGRQFLTERQVCERFGVSRVTANKALSHLVIEGALELRKGLGTFVREPALDYDLQSLTSFTRKVELAGRMPATRVSRFEQMEARKAGESVRAALQADGAESLYYFERLRLADNIPVILEKRWVLGRAVPGLTRKQVMGSFYRLLIEKFELRVTGARQTIRAINLPPEDAALLKVKAGTAGLWVHAIGHTHAPIWLEDTFYRGDMYEFRNCIGDQHGISAGESGIHSFARPKRVAE